MKIGEYVQIGEVVQDAQGVIAYWNNNYDRHRIYGTRGGTGVNDIYDVLLRRRA